MDKIKLYNNTEVEIIVDSSLSDLYLGEEFMVSFVHSAKFTNKQLVLRYSTVDQNKHINKVTTEDGVIYSLTINSHLHRPQWLGLWTIYLSYITPLSDSPLTGQLPLIFEYVEPTFLDLSVSKLVITLMEVGGTILVNTKYFTLNESDLDSNDLLK